MFDCIDFAFIPAAPIPDVVELAQLGESLGYRGIWIPDQGFHRDPFVVLHAIAQGTRRLKLGVGITSPFTRHPVQIARAAATLAEVSRGRFRLGIGTGNVTNVVAPLGIRYEKPVARIRDAVNIIRRLLGGEVVDFEGPFDHLSGVRLDFDVSHPVPIYLGTRGPRVLELAGEVADGALCETLFAPNAWQYVEEHVAIGLERGGRARDSFDANAWQLIFVTHDEAALIERYRSWAARSIQAGPPSMIALIGVSPTEAEAVRNAPSQHSDAGGGQDEHSSGAATALVGDDAVRRHMIVGSPEEVLREVHAVLGRGANSLTLLDTGPIDSVELSLRRFGEDVLREHQ
jgi:5,10-methylenetetrahydromethanopterin reductase